MRPCRLSEIEPRGWDAAQQQRQDDWKTQHDQNLYGKRQVQHSDDDSSHDFMVDLDSTPFGRTVQANVEDGFQVYMDR